MAIKILPPELADQPGFQERFRREAQSLAKLDHPNIVLIHELAITAGHLYFVMDFVVGRNLAQIMQEHRDQKKLDGVGTLTFQTIINLVQQICEALQAAHERNIIHRDIKPANILVTNTGKVKVADFGLARSLTPDEAEITEPHEIMGTADYMAPEVHKGEPADERSDQYSVGVLLYELLAGMKPRGNFAAPSALGTFHPKVDAIVLKALETAPAKRYPKIANLAAALQRLRPHHGNWKRWRAPGIALGAVAVASLATAALWPQTPQTPAPAVPPAPPPRMPLPPGIFFIESFDYPVGENLLPEYGYFRKYPTESAAADIIPNSLEYTDAAGNRLLTKGNAAHVDTEKESHQVDDITPISLPPDTPDIIWLSLIAKQTAGTTDRFFNLSLRAPDNTSKPMDNDKMDDEILAVGISSKADHQVWRIWDRTISQQETRFKESTTPSTSQTFLLVRMEANVDGGHYERYTLWVNPLLGQPPAESAGFTFTSMHSNVERWTQLTKMRLGAGFGTGPMQSSGFIVDEIRLGVSASIVMPIAPP